MALRYGQDCDGGFDSLGRFRLEIFGNEISSGDGLELSLPGIGYTVATQADAQITVPAKTVSATLDAEIAAGTLQVVLDAYLEESFTKTIGMDAILDPPAQDTVSVSADALLLKDFQTHDPPVPTIANLDAILVTSAGPYSDPIKSESQKFAPSNLVEFWDFDITAHASGQAVLYWVSGTDGGAAMQFDGRTYLPIALESRGFEVNAGGAQPRPTLRVANTDNSIGILCNHYEDCVGGIVRRRRTYADFLDGHSGVRAQFPAETYIIERKVAQNEMIVEWELVGFLDLDGKEFCKERVYKDVCPFLYRKWDGSKWVYYDCEYSGSGMFDINGDPVTSELEDICGRRMSDCELRFGSTAELGFGGFPGVGDRYG